MEQLTLIEIGSHTNKDLATLMANFGWVSKFLMQKTPRNAAQLFWTHIFINLTKTYRPQKHKQVDE